MDFLNPITEIGFKKMLGDKKYPALTISFLNAMLELPEGKRITSIIHNNTENLPIVDSATKTFLDINCTDQAGKEYIVEVQRQNEGNFMPRVQFYSSYCLARQIKTRRDYPNLKPVILLAVVKEFNLFERHDRYLTHHVMVDHYDGVQDMGYSEFHFVELKKFEKGLDEIKDSVADQWIYLLNNAQDHHEIPELLSNNEELREAMLLLEHAKLSQKEFEAYIAQDEAEGREENIEKTAMQIGEAKGRIEVAKELLAEGMAVEKIAKLTGLSIEKVRVLKG